MVSQQSKYYFSVLAQELRKVLPSAVQVLQNVTLADGTMMPELLGMYGI